MHIRFLFVTFAILGLGDILWWRRADARLRKLSNRNLSRAALAGFMTLQITYLALSILAPDVVRSSRAPIPVPVHAIAFIWHLLVLPVLLISNTLTGIGTWLALAIRRAAQFIQSPQRPVPSAAPDRALPSRRQALAAAAVAVPPLLTAAAAGASEFEIGGFRINRFDLVQPQLPPEFDGLTLAHLSDIHVGKFTRPNSLSKIAQAVNQLRADFVVVTGDLIDLALSDLPIALDLVRRLDPRHGLFICEGNHDLIEDPVAFETRVKAAGMPLLLDEAQTIAFRGRPLQFLGLRWARADVGIAQSMSRLRPLLQAHAFPILLAHHPHAFDEAAATAIPLTLSGHTHGGQLMLNRHIGFGPLMFRYWSGLYRKRGANMIVSNGVGNWFPLRINAPAEIGHITLRASLTGSGSRETATLTVSQAVA